MPLFIPDISHHQAGIDIQALKNQGAAALIARVGQGAGRRSNGQTYGTTRDREWARHRDEARRVGLPLIAYWYTGNLISADENAALAEQWVGDKSIPWMLDHEDASGSIVFYHQVKEAFARRGLRVVLGYVPYWYWSAQASPKDLAPGPRLVNSRYSTASGTPAQIYAAANGDNGLGWVTFGGQSTALWQFTNKASMAGRAIDCSAFRGTREQLAVILGGQEEDMSMYDKVKFALPDGSVVEKTHSELLAELYKAHLVTALAPEHDGKSETVHDAVWDNRSRIEAIKKLISDLGVGMSTALREALATALQENPPTVQVDNEAIAKATVAELKKEGN